MASDTEVFASLRQARKVLRQRGHPCHTSAREFVRWHHTETPYPNPTFDEIVSNPFFVVHELVEIEEVRRMGLRMTKDVIVKNPLPIAGAHLRAAEVEFRVAYDLKDVNHLRRRVEDAKAWCEDPVLTPALKKRHEAFREKWTRTLSRLA
jgi:hypothetical protein